MFNFTLKITLVPLEIIYIQNPKIIIVNFRCREEFSNVIWLCQPLIILLYQNLFSYQVKTHELQGEKMVQMGGRGLLFLPYSLNHFPLRYVITSYNLSHSVRRGFIHIGVVIDYDYKSKRICKRIIFYGVRVIYYFYLEIF